MDLKIPVYLDYNATTPVDPRVVEAMTPYFSEVFGNAASETHAFGWHASEAVEEGRLRVAELIGAAAGEIVFTSGATESDNLAIKGVAEISEGAGRHIVTSQAEHKAVVDPCRYLESRGWDVTWLSPDEQGVVTPEQVAEALRDDTVLVSIMAANNETGVLADIEGIGRTCKQHGVLFHTDATQAAGKIPLDVRQAGIDLLSISAHKLYGPKGIGALYVRSKEPRVRLAIQMHGGGHEKGRRSGTLNVPGIVGFGEACRIAQQGLGDEPHRMEQLRDRLEEGIFSQLPAVARNGHPEFRLPNTANLSFGFIDGEALITKMRDVAVSTGSACTSADHAGSHVLQAMGVSDVLSHGSIRFSLGRMTTEEQIDFAIEKVIVAVRQLRELSPFYDEQAAKAGAMEPGQCCGGKGCCGR